MGVGTEFSNDQSTIPLFDHIWELGLNFPILLIVTRIAEPQSAPDARGGRSHLHCPCLTNDVLDIQREKTNQPTTRWISELQEAKCTDQKCAKPCRKKSHLLLICLSDTSVNLVFESMKYS
jgi:hypothetical protein